MRVVILGSAAGGGLPQWNCRCDNCAAARAGVWNVRPRTQSSVAVSADGVEWFLLNVSADVCLQLSSTEALWPPTAGGRRGTPVAGCLLTDAEIDHCSGLLQLREGCRFGVLSTPIVRRWLEQYLPLKTILTSFADRPWTDLTLGEKADLPLADGSISGLRVEAFEVGRDTPRFVPEDALTAVGSVIGLRIEDTQTGGALVYAPGVPAIGGELEQAVGGASLLLIDGTFWDDEEPIREGITDRTSSEMGHAPVSGPNGTLEWLAQLPIRHRVYVHINNTNPMLDESGDEHKKVRRLGVAVGADGDGFEI